MNNNVQSTRMNALVERPKHITINDLAGMVQRGFLDVRSEFKQEFKTLNERIGGIECRLDSVENRLGSVENRLESVENRLDSVEHRLDSVDSRFSSLQGQFDNIYLNYTFRRKAKRS